MTKLILVLAIFLFTASVAQPQSLKSISGNRFILKDSINTSYLDSSLNKKNEIKKESKKGDYATISTGLFVASKYRSRDNNVPYTSFDLNINVGSIVYLDLGIYGLFFSKEPFYAGHIALGTGFDIMPDILFTYAGIGCFSIIPYTFSGFLTLRVNYKFTKDISAGLDNKFYFDMNSEDLSLYLYSIGLNFSYRFNY